MSLFSWWSMNNHNPLHIGLLPTPAVKIPTGKSLNSITAKGPNMLSDPYRIMLRFRNRKYAISTDVTKAYHGLRTGPVEMHLRRVVHRRKSETEWKTYGFLCVSFGDVAAQAILEVCLQRVAEKNKHID